MQQDTSTPLIRFYTKVSQQTEQGLLSRYLETKASQGLIKQIPTTEKLYLPPLINGEYNFDLFITYNSSFLEIEKLSDSQKQRLGFSKGFVLDEKLLPRLNNKKRSNLIPILQRQLLSDFDNYLRLHPNPTKNIELTKILKEKKEP